MNIGCDWVSGRGDFLNREQQRRDQDCPETPEAPEELDPQDTEKLRDQIKGQTKEHAKPPRLEDEGQSGG